MGPVYDAPLPEVQISTDSAVLARGEYLVTARRTASSAMGRAEALQKLEEGRRSSLSGGLRLVLGPLGAIARNLMPDSETGIGCYTDAQIARMMRGRCGRTARLSSR